MTSAPRLSLVLMMLFSLAELVGRDDVAAILADRKDSHRPLTLPQLSHLLAARTNLLPSASQRRDDDVTQRQSHDVIVRELDVGQVYNASLLHSVDVVEADAKTGCDVIQHPLQELIAT